ncbi:MAG: methylated-DNA--[protein]-cysteine S-methyltransferase [Candidatus Eremiobacteraeota bacterium]|nr:methylated-DNA--[protein]-cysteine S-methyltransferase [Candidatus Eremiobacteraeota bacterium]
MMLATPFGRHLHVTCSDGGVTESRFVAKPAGHDTERSHPLEADVRRQLDAYFARKLRRFDVPLVLAGTPFQVEVWRAVAAIPSGALASYADVARAIGRPNAHRAVAAALTRTPLALFVPAHRVVGADGRARGAAPGSLRRRLIAFEAAPSARSASRA